MFFIISKLLSFLLNPLVWFLGLLIWVFFIKDRKKQKKILLITIILFYFFSNSFIISELYRLWEVQPVKTQELKTYDVGVVLGGGMITYDAAYERYSFRHNPDRIMQAVYLYNQNKINTILISGGSGMLVYRNMRESVMLKDFLVNYMHIPAGDILIDSLSDNTYQNAVQSRIIIEEHFHNPEVLLITSGFHMRRAFMCFKKQNLDVDVYSTNLRVGRRRFHADHLLIPSLWSLGLWQSLLHEIIGIGMYKIMGYA